MDDNDADAEIDPDLFVKCRLCIEENGSYQIHQSLQAKIKYCFDITVKHLDRLPQLVCKKCRNILNEYHDIKKKFVENQNKLAMKSKRINPQLKNEAVVTQLQDESGHEKQGNQGEQPSKEQQVTSSQDDSDVIGRPKRAKKRKNLILSTSSNSSNEVFSNIENVQESHITWEQNFQKIFVCRFCKFQCKAQNLIIRHVKLHSTLLKKCKSYIKKHCKILLDKVDDRPNFTGECKVVVLSPSKLICDVDNYKYSVNYVPNDEEKRMGSLHRPSILRKDKLKRTSATYDTSDDDVPAKPKKNKNILKRRTRFRSSSNETVVLNSNKSPVESDKEEVTTSNQNAANETTNDLQCIDIEDTSTDTCDSNIHIQQSLLTRDKDYKTILDINTGCLNNYLKTCKIDNEDKSSKKSTHSDELLHRKLLSLGRKVITPQGISCPGILKYLQHKHLVVKWSPNEKKDKQMEYIRIITKIESIDSNEEIDWIPVQENNTFVKDIFKDDKSDSGFPQNMPCVISTELEPEPYIETCNIQNNSELESSSRSMFFNQETTLEPVESDYFKNKLLNANPVANPKQLPKKNAPSDVKPNTNKIQFSNTLTGETVIIDLDNEPSQDSGLPMPIITSTTSLAQDPCNRNGEGATNINSDNISVPRIKCKPVSELMPPEKNGRVSAANMPISIAPSVNTNFNAGFNVNMLPSQPGITQMPNYITITPLVVSPTSINSTQLGQTLNFYPSSVVPTPQTSSQVNNSRIVMHTVHLPNTPTSHPIEYLKTLLKMHDLNLLTQVNKVLSRDFICLVKFRLDVSQKDRLVVLSLALHASSTEFCLKLRNQTEEMNIDSLPAHWQVHIIKAFDGDVSEKILQCAMKVSPLFYDKVRKFVYLLKNIEYK